MRTAQEIGTLAINKLDKFMVIDFYKAYQNDAKQTEHLKWSKMYVSLAEVPPGALDTSMEVANGPFARWRLFTIETRTDLVFIFIFKFGNPSEV